ncbi:hypothetical protein V492_07163 [Pseudogymnoascus sp. VKM F-4246]|nr:hypothetical protein V492_07163 [Pseudogymnoascus sp. VKM F-4246]
MDYASPVIKCSSFEFDQSGPAGLEGRLLPQVLDTLASTDPHHVLGMAARLDISEGFDSYTALQFSQGVNYTAHWLESQTDLSDTIAYIGIHDFRYWIMELAAIKVGHPLLLPSPRNAIPNTMSLLEATKCSVIFYSGSCKEQATHLQSLVAGLKIVEVPSLEDMVSTPSKPYPHNKTWQEAKDDTVIIVHTSGSTGAPKPIFFTNTALAFTDFSRLNPKIPGRLSPNVYSVTAEKKPFLSSTPFFHLSGLFFGVYTIFCPATAVVFAPNSVPSAKMIVDIIKNVELYGLVIVPSLSDAVFSEYREEILPYLGSVEQICWGGGPLAQSTGDWIVKNTKAHIWQIFGSTETGAYYMMEPPKSHWNYMEFHPITGPTIEQISPGSDLYEVVTRRHPDPNFAWSRMVFDVFPDLDEWRSKDLLSKCKDPGFEHLWRYEGRTDDMLVLSNALKVNPVHIEASMQDHPALKGSLVFGKGHTKCGMLIEAKNLELKGDALIEEIWPMLEHVNATIPEHARIRRDFIIVADPEKPFKRASKGTVVRSLTTKDYEDEIESLYRVKGLP